MFRSRRSPTGALAIAVALAVVLAAAPAAASGGNVDPRSPRTPQSVNASDVAKEKTEQAMPGPRRPGWVESLLGRLVPKPPKHTCPAG